MPYPIILSQGWSDIADEVDEEIRKARQKFPLTPNVTLALAEECGEAIREVMNLYHCDPRADRQKLRKELIQTMAMCVRLETEGDSLAGIQGSVKA